MQLTETERMYICCLAEGMSFEDMAFELGWTVQEVENFGTAFFERVFEIRTRRIM